MFGLRNQKEKFTDQSLQNLKSQNKAVKFAVTSICGYLGVCIGFSTSTPFYDTVSAKTSSYETNSHILTEDSNPIL